MRTGTDDDHAALRNFDLKEEIRAYWDRRSETFDQSAGHGVRTQDELRGWSNILARHIASPENAHVLELACGTGEFTRALLALGCRVDGLDFSEGMMARAKAKHASKPVRFILGDAEAPMLPNATYDAVVCRHLVWTLTAPRQAFTEWWRVLRPGGVIVIIDGHWSSSDWFVRTIRWAGAGLDRLRPPKSLYDASIYQNISPHLYFPEGPTASAIIALLDEAGFEAVEQRRLTGVLGPQLRSATWRERVTLLQSSRQSYIVTARRPYEEQ